MDEIKSNTNSGSAHDEAANNTEPALAVLKKESPENTPTTEPKRNKQETRTNLAEIPSLPQRIWLWVKHDTTSTDWLIVLLTAAIALTSYLQWREIRSGSTDTHALAQAANTQAQRMGDMSTAADQIRQAAQDMASNEKRVADDTEKALDASNEQAMIAQRAWLEVTTETVPLKSGEPFLPGQSADFRVRITNTGRTPALDVRYEEVWCVDRKNKNAKIPCPSFVYKTYSSPTNIMPNGGSYHDFEQPINVTAYAEIKSNEVTQYSHGRVTYDDVFGKHHWVTYCDLLLPTGAWANCKTNNEVDKTAN